MKLEHYKPRSARAARRKEKPKRKGKISTRKSQMLALAQKLKPATSPQLHEDYSTKIEWVRKLIPKLRKEAEAPE